jgi:hypothetical protein
MLENVDVITILIIGFMVAPTISLLINDLFKEKNDDSN